MGARSRPGPRPRWHLTCLALDRAPAARLCAVEALCTLPLSVSTLLVTAPGPARVPEWVQVWGLAVLLALAGATVHAYRLTLAKGSGRYARSGHAPGGNCPPP
ncbi:hypothetical protein SSCG_04541 [Streptomyces clavuligerus]|nr:hypothetical protein [Streptomyces clavuligerus]EDY51383.1 hypothetical protein SSCG_04541 [Streptomyces clavuligerus]